MRKLFLPVILEQSGIGPAGLKNEGKVVIFVSAYLSSVCMDVQERS